LAAITHADGTARAQTVTESQNPKMHALLTAFKQRTGYGVLCNTSLNFSGCGFINRLSDLVAYARQVGLDGFVVGDVFYVDTQAIRPMARAESDKPTWVRPHQPFRPQVPLRSAS
jgi:predicted NodU family carbamoyl transferase